GVDEAGAPIAVDDPAGARLLELAAAQKDGDDRAFVSDIAVFGDLAGEERFVEEFASQLKALRAEGARARMRALVG
ncbi:MAG: mannitol dehydrogenase family protein, partial [Schaalia georgiae]|nr:mannitol dehydrogenase family protein [Schaalia georgiae]